METTSVKMLALDAAESCGFQVLLRQGNGQLTI
jgi:hypothetical protein